VRGEVKFEKTKRSKEFLDLSKQKENKKDKQKKSKIQCLVLLRKTKEKKMAHSKREKHFFSKKGLRQNLDDFSILFLEFNKIKQFLLLHQLLLIVV
jgi:hypothetical protein